MMNLIFHRQTAAIQKPEREDQIKGPPFSCSADFVPFSYPAPRENAPYTHTHSQPATNQAQYVS